MPRQSSEEFKELVRSRTDIVGLIGEGISLQPRRGGQEFVGLCPFHDDSNPSLRVYPERQSFRCWSCNTGGDCFEFVMQSEGVGFREALELLATRARVELPKTFHRSSQGNGTGKAQLYDAVAWAEQQFHDCLLKSPQAAAAREYLAARGFTEQTISDFRLGFHPNEWEWLINRARGKYSQALLAEARLISERDGGRGYYDYFVDRVLFPIRDMQRRAVAFGGRILPGNTNENLPKYFNSVESVIFTKSQLLYGLDHARDAIRKSETVVVVEGYTDCITAHQYGQQNVVATLGTALTTTHVTNLKRFARNVVLVFDGDEAGQASADRALSNFLAQEVNLRILTLEHGLDPAEYLQQHGLGAFANKITKAPEAWQHKLRSTLNKYGRDTIDGRDRILNEMLEVVAAVPHTTQADAGKWRSREDLIIGSLVQSIPGVKEPAVRQQLAELRKRNHERGRERRFHAEPAHAMNHDNNGAAQINQDISKIDRKLERELLQIIFADPTIVTEMRAHVDCNEIQDPQLRTLLACCYEIADAREEPALARVLAKLEHSALKGLAVSLDEEARRKGIKAELLEQTLPCFKDRRDPKSAELSGRLRTHTGGDLDDETAAMLRRHSDINSKRVVKHKLA